MNHIIYIYICIPWPTRTGNFAGSCCRPGVQNQNPGFWILHTIHSQHRCSIFLFNSAVAIQLSPCARLGLDHSKQDTQKFQNCLSAAQQRERIYIYIYIYFILIYKKVWYIILYTNKAKTEEPSAIIERVAPRYDPLCGSLQGLLDISQKGNVKGLETPRKTTHISNTLQICQNECTNEALSRFVSFC